jgi:hypothetical protein
VPMRNPPRHPAPDDHHQRQQRSLPPTHGIHSTRKISNPESCDVSERNR